MRCLEISRLRNLASVRLDLHPHFNYLIGPNGAGKTSILEAVYLLARSRSFRGQAIAPIIAHGEEDLLVRATMENGRTLGLAKTRLGATALHMDDQPVRKLSAGASLLPVQLLLPNVSDLVFGPPNERRRYLDWGLFHVKQSYLGALRDFQAAYKQRNAALKSWGRQNSEHLLEVWTDAYARHAAAVDQFRSQYLAELRPHVDAALERLEVNFEVRLGYQNGWGERPLLKLLGETLPKDVKLGTTQVGPHRADLSLDVHGGPARMTLSRGQGKLLAMALILAQARLLQAQSERRSLFLIDEVGAEMDSHYLAKMLALLSADTCQVIATSTKPPSQEFGAAFEGRELRLFHVEQGSVDAGAATKEF